MDGPATSLLEPHRTAMEMAARDMGVVPGDAAYPFMQGMLGLIDRLAEENARQRTEIRALLGEAKTAASGELARMALDELPRSIDRLVLQRCRWMVVAAVVTILVALGAGVALDRWVLPASVPVAINCAPHASGQPFPCTVLLRGG